MQFRPENRALTDKLLSMGANCRSDWSVALHLRPWLGPVSYSVRARRRAAAYVTPAAGRSTLSCRSGHCGLTCRVLCLRSLSSYRRRTPKAHSNVIPTGPPSPAAGGSRADGAGRHRQHRLGADARYPLARAPAAPARGRPRRAGVPRAGAAGRRGAAAGRPPTCSSADAGRCRWPSRCWWRSGSSTC